MCAVVVLASEWWRNVERFLNQRLKLTLNRGKSRVVRPWVCDYLGYGMSYMNQALPKKLWGALGLVSILDQPSLSLPQIALIGFFLSGSKASPAYGSRCAQESLAPVPLGGRATTGHPWPDRSSSGINAG